MKENQWKMKGKPIQTEKQKKKTKKNPEKNPHPLKKHMFNVYICWMVFVMRTAFCSNRLLHKYFVESTAPPSRCDVNILTNVFLKNVITDLYSENGTDLVSKSINLNSGMPSDCFC